MAPKREPVPESVRQEIMRKQESKCANCGRCLKSVVAELDHTPRIHESPKQELQWLCQPCHTTKSGEERRTGNTYSIQSRFSPHAKTLFRDIPAPQPYVLHLTDSPGKGYPSCWQLDAIRCRSNAWKYSSSDFSVFCVLDSIHVGSAMSIRGVVRCRDGISVLNFAHIGFTLHRDHEDKMV